MPTSRIATREPSDNDRADTDTYEDKPSGRGSPRDPATHPIRLNVHQAPLSLNITRGGGSGAGPG